MHSAVPPVQLFILMKSTRLESLFASRSTRSGCHLTLALAFDWWWHSQANRKRLKHLTRVKFQLERTNRLTRVFLSCDVLRVPNDSATTKRLNRRALFFISTLFCVSVFDFSKLLIYDFIKTHGRFECWSHYVTLRNAQQNRRDKTVASPHIQASTNASAVNFKGENQSSSLHHSRLGPAKLICSDASRARLNLNAFIPSFRCIHFWQTTNLNFLSLSR